MKKSLLLFLILFFIMPLGTGCGASHIPGTTDSSVPAKSTVPDTYGVFVGLNPEDTSLLDGYATVVIDASAFTAQDIDALHRCGHTVYSYLNIGSLEDFRDYYEQFQDMTLGAYENWPGEWWIDVSRPEWQDFLTKKLAGGLAKKGIDGFFLDNADVYYNYPREDIYDGIQNILTGLAQYGLPLIINGGDTFVTEALSRGKINRDEAAPVFDGVNQETVFTSIDFANGSFGIQQPEETAYFQSYLARCLEAGLAVYLTEYGADETLAEVIRSFCAENGYACFIANSLALD